MTNLQLINYASYIDPASGHPRIGHLDTKDGTIQPLSFKSGTPIADLYQVIEAGEEHIAPSGAPIPSSSVKLLPPISGRDVLAVGKNYAEHAKEFNSSGYDSSDKVDQPSHPVIFTKRATSIIAHGDEIYSHKEFTKTLDYEGEIGVIIGKAGFRISQEDAMDHVWGFTIINDITARERQRDHKQFFIGKSADTFCPMGPIAVPAKHLPNVLRVQTHINGELRQEATTDDLIFSIPFLVYTLSEGTTLRPGDVIATGTPAGVGFGQKPPVFLQPDDEISITVTGLGTLRNKVAVDNSTNETINRIEKISSIPASNSWKAPNGVGLTDLGGKRLRYETRGRKPGPGVPAVVFIHGLGSSLEYWSPLVDVYEPSSSDKGSQKCSIHLFDLEGHGLSPTSSLDTLSISSFVSDVDRILRHEGISSRVSIVGHSIGSLIALSFAISNPDAVEKLVLLSPPPLPLSENDRKTYRELAVTARSGGMPAIFKYLELDQLAGDLGRRRPPVALTAIKFMLLGQDPEGYAKACSALADSPELDLSKVKAEVLIIAGENDGFSHDTACTDISERLPHSREVVRLPGGHWNLFEAVDEIGDEIEEFLGDVWYHDELLG